MNSPKVKPTSALARSLCTVLLNNTGLPTVLCPITLTKIEGISGWKEAVKYNKAGVGAHYIAFGFVYVLCYSPVEGSFVMVYHQRSRALVGTVYDSTEILLAEGYSC